MERAPDFSIIMEICDREFVFTMSNAWLIEYDAGCEKYNHICFMGEQTTLIFDSDEERDMLRSCGWETVTINSPSDLVLGAWKEYENAMIAHEEAENLDEELAKFLQ